MKPNELVVGKTYFHCGYHHLNYPIPRIQAYVYVGINIFDGDYKSDHEHYFKEPEAYYAADFIGVPGYEDCNFEDPENKMILLVEEEYLDNFRDYKDLIEWLTELSKDENAKKVF